MPRMDISDHYDAIARCNRCGFCQVSCPIYRATGHEAGVARGRLALLRALIEDRISWSRELEEPLFACLLCGACTANCFPAVATVDLILAARTEYLDRVSRSPLHRLLFNHLLPYPRRLRLAARAAALGKRSGISRVARALGLLRFLGRDFPKAEAIVERFPAMAFRERFKAGSLSADEPRQSPLDASQSAVKRAEKPEGEEQQAPGIRPGGRATNTATSSASALRIGYFVGCGVDILCPEAGEATVGLLRAMGASVTVLDNCCCGLPAETYGDRQAAQRLAAKNLELLATEPLDLIATDCSSCAAFLKRYPRLFAPDDSRHQAAEAVASRVRDWMELAVGVESPESEAQSHEVPVSASEPGIARSRCLVVTYHDPCHASRGQGIAAQPRRVLQSLAGVEYRELPEADWCCGGAGSYALSHYDLSRRVLDRKIDNVEKTGANVLATSCPACIVHLSYGVRLRGLAVQVCHLSELMSGRIR